MIHERYSCDDGYIIDEFNDDGGDYNNAYVNDESYDSYHNDSITASIVDDSGVDGGCSHERDSQEDCGD